MKDLFKCEEFDLENFDLAESLVMETIDKSFVLSFEKEKDELRKVEKKK